MYKITNVQNLPTCLDRMSKGSLYCPLQALQVDYTLLVPLDRAWKTNVIGKYVYSNICSLPGCEDQILNLHTYFSDMLMCLQLHL